MVSKLLKQEIRNPLAKEEEKVRDPMVKTEEVGSDRKRLRIAINGKLPCI